MPKFRFDPKTLGRPGKSVPDMSCPEPPGALQAFMSLRPGIQAIEEIARLADIEWSKPVDPLTADDVDPTERREGDRDLPD